MSFLGATASRLAASAASTVGATVAKESGVEAVAASSKAAAAAAAGPVLRLRTRVLNALDGHPTLQKYAGHEAGPFTIHFWAPAWKWGLVIAGLADLKRPPEKVSTAQSLALSCTGVIWSRYATVISPVNYNLLSVNVFVAATGLYALYRKHVVAGIPFSLSPHSAHAGAGAGAGAGTVTAPLATTTAIPRFAVQQQLGAPAPPQPNPAPPSKLS